MASFLLLHSVVQTGTIAAWQGFSFKEQLVFPVILASKVPTAQQRVLHQLDNQVANLHDNLLEVPQDSLLHSPRGSRPSNQQDDHHELWKAHQPLLDYHQASQRASQQASQLALFFFPSLLPFPTLERHKPFKFLVV